LNQSPGASTSTLINNGVFQLSIGITSTGLELGSPAGWVLQSLGTSTLGSSVFGSAFRIFWLTENSQKKRLGSPHKCVAGGIPTIIPFFAGQKKGSNCLDFQNKIVNKN